MPHGRRFTTKSSQGEHIISKTAFLYALARQLALRGVPYIRPQLEAFVDDVWPLAEDDPGVTWWADAFAEADDEQPAR
jgi:hypothetical protein